MTIYSIAAPSLVATLTVWDKTSGTWINIITVLLGTLLGLSIRGRLPQTIQQVITQGLGLFTLFLGLTLANSMLKAKAGPIDGIILGLLAMVLGGVIGESLNIEAQLTNLGDWLKDRCRGTGRFTEGFVISSLLFCIGPITIVGCLNNGLSGNNNLLTVKAVMDGLAAIAFSSIYGIGVGFSIIPILIYQGGLSLFAGLLTQTLPNPTINPHVQMISGVGGLMVLGIGFNLLDLARLRVSSFLPALILAPALLTLVRMITG
ncbi:DUF554 domain-containing protein [Alkalinema pantanalense CENA528]|uniref:DUF554 domain-containing protein n=1 Tax=Alkalinema pantanalense TaxID=1620705 RepID=UPI003D6DC173